MPNVPQKVLDLVEIFERNADEYRSGDFNEANLRIQFVNPLFETLGWDMDNEQGLAEAYKDVIHEDAIKVGGATKAPDYCFRISQTPKFFVEAKKPSINIKTDPKPAFQLRRYGWSRKLPLSILTDFEEFAVYDCRFKPALHDKASDARILYLRYTDYATQWDQIAGVFAREAILKGSFDKYAESNKAKRGTTPVDAAFLKEIEEWRFELAKNLALRNRNLTPRQLNYAVQTTIDRIIFLRLCEDRGIEPYGRLQQLLDHPGIYEDLCKLFHKADQRYNSGLFHFENEKDRLESPDELTTTLKIDDQILKTILKSIYYPSPYVFKEIPADILGQVYEQFLGKVIRLTTGHNAKIEEKPEVKKAGGVYYTPTYIVDYIVKHTVGKLLGDVALSLRERNAAPASDAIPQPDDAILSRSERATLTPKQAHKLRILDPACGSGSFLLGAYKYLLDWHRDWYVADGPDKHRKELFQGPGGGWRLTTAEKKRILLNNIYGVDIDPQAVEVTKLSLLLKVLEGESHDTLESQRLLWHERALPDLASNIKCGNSLIGPDFYADRQPTLFDDEERYRINVFDWNKEFPGIFQGGGFHAVIGNPPWGQKAIEEGEAVKQYVWQVYPSSKGIFDLFRPFVERGLRLLADAGKFGMVLPDIVLLKNYPETRRYLLEQLSLERIDWWGMAFAAAVIDAVTIIGSKEPAAASHCVGAAVHDGEAPFSQSIPQTDFWANPRFVFNLYLTSEKRQVLEQLGKLPKLGDYFEIHEGVHSGNIRAELFVPSQVDRTCRELYFGRGEIAPFRLQWEGQHIRLGAVPESKTRQRYANVGKPEWHESDKVLVRRTGDFVLAAVDRSGRYASNNFFLVFPKQECWLDLDGLCALLNSRFMTWFFRTIEPRRGRVFAELKIKHLTTFPLPFDAQVCQDLNRFGAERTALAAKLARASTPKDAAVLERTGHYLDSRIEELVRGFFGIPKHLGDGSTTERS